MQHVVEVVKAMRRVLEVSAANSQSGRRQSGQVQLTGLTAGLTETFSRAVS